MHESFWNELARHYGDKRGEWQSEKGSLEAQIAEIAELLHPTYTIDKPLGVGGGGVAIKVIDNKLSVDGDTNYAVLKIPRPLEGRASQPDEILQRETNKLRGLRHQNLIRILTLDTTPSGTHFFVMEYIAESMDADKYLQANPTFDTLIRILLGACTGISHMHRVNLLHMDIKPANIFCSTDGSVVVADLGFAKRVDQQQTGTTKYVGGTAGYKHPDHDLLIHEASSSQLDTGEAEREMRMDGTPVSRLRKEWDLYSLGITLAELIRVLELREPRTIRDYRHRYLKLMAHRMVGSNVAYAQETTKQILAKHDSNGRPLLDDNYIGLRRDALTQLQYPTIDDVLADLQKLIGAQDLLRQVPELRIQQHAVIQAASHGPVPFTNRIRLAVDSDEFRALSRVDQLGLVKLSYPSATHSRLEHSLGTLGMAAQFARALYGDPINPIFRQIMDDDDIRLLLAVSLVHDIGHYPLAHDLEEVDRSIFSHERRTVALLEGEQSELGSILRSTENGWSIPRGAVERIVGPSPTSLSLKEMVIRSIINGPIDADKVDYLIRDSENLRLPYGQGIDVRKLLQCITVVVADEGGRSSARIGIHEKGRIPAESVAFARYSMYGSVYWHRTHRTLKAMLNRLGLEAMDHARSSNSSRYKDLMRRRLDDFLDANRQAQLTLDMDERENRKASPFLGTSTQQMIWWLAEQLQSPSFDELADDILFRRLYKRVMVVSRARNPGTSDWDRVVAIFGRVGENWQGRHQVMKLLQQRVTALVERWDGHVPLGYSAVPAETRQNFLDLSAKAPLIIVDFPPTKSGSSSGLEYLREPEWEDQGRTDLHVDHIEESSAWTALTKEYARSLGKLRVYCHPTYAALVTAAIPRQAMETMTFSVIKDVA